MSHELISIPAIDLRRNHLPRLPKNTRLYTSTETVWAAAVVLGPLRLVFIRRR